MNQINISNNNKKVIVTRLQDYFIKELDQELGQFDAEFLLDFFTKEIGSAFYNQGLSDAQTVLTAKIDDINDAIYQLEQPSNL